ncbi:hypothetical protein PUN4_550248 [Paraburkholderia unamae]|nr:hypothetical protein PUN4_550248 [Paraburkholderia unamae]
MPRLATVVAGQLVQSAQTSMQEFQQHDAVDVFIGVDVGKGQDHAVALGRNGKRLYDKALPNDEAKLRALIGELKVHARSPSLAGPDQNAGSRRQDRPQTPHRGRAQSIRFGRSPGSLRWPRTSYPALRLIHTWRASVQARQQGAQTRLVLSAFAALRDPISRAYYARKVQQGKRHNQALIALARRR